MTGAGDPVPPAGASDVPKPLPGFPITDPALVGVTGGIGTGKTTLCRLLADQEGWPLLDADRLGHEALDRSSSVFSGIVHRFGPAILDETGVISRPRLAAVVFADPAALADLNRITHPWILERLRRDLLALRGGGYAGIILLDAALLLDWRERIRPRWTVVVIAPLRVRLRRLEARGMPRREALGRIRSQEGDAGRRRNADWTVENGGTLDELAEKARDLAERIRTGRGFSQGTDNGR